MTLVILELIFEISKETKGLRIKSQLILIVMKTTKKSIDSLKSQEVNVKKVKGGTSAKATRSPNPSSDSLVNPQKVILQFWGKI